MSLPKSRKRPDGILPNFAGFISSSRGNVDLGMTQMVALSRLDPCLHLLSLILRVHCQPTCDLYLGVRQVAHSRIDPACNFGLGFLVLCHLRDREASLDWSPAKPRATSVSPPGSKHLINFIVRRRIGLAGNAGEASVSYHGRTDGPDGCPAVTPSALTRISHTPAKKPYEFIRTLARIALPM
jgi:hypothetical protein